MRRSPKQTRLWTACVTVLLLSGGVVGAKDDLRLRARVIGPGGSNALKGKADYRLRDDRARRKFKVEVENGTPGSLLDVLVAGEVVGTIEVSGLGVGRLEFDDQASTMLMFARSSSGSDDDDSDEDSDSDSDGDSDEDSDGDSDGDSDEDSDGDSDGDSDEDSDADSDSDESSDSGSSDDSGGNDSSIKQPFPSNFPVLNGGELIQVGPLTGTFQHRG